MTYTKFEKKSCHGVYGISVITPEFIKDKFRLYFKYSLNLKLLKIRVHYELRIQF